MRKSKLILIDGITGSGKSTTGRFLAEQLKANNIAHRLYEEEEPGHPLNYTAADIEELGPEEVENFIIAMPPLWQRFVHSALDSDEVFIIESYIFQDTIRILFQNNVARERIFAFAHRQLEIIRPMNPVLIWLWTRDVNQSIRRIWATRGEQWKQWFIRVDTATPYALANHLQGEEGAITLWEHYQDLTKELFDSYDIARLAVEVSPEAWERNQEEIIRFLGLSEI
ncbi:MAG: hypothetical protein FH749_09865 [Firmicutes bacterium]|nr:hypothetical protein [Bacillota bacterium]